MIVTVEVGLATSRPPREHQTAHVMVAVDVVDFNFLSAEIEAELIAIAMAVGAADAVMAVRSQILEITEI